MKQILEIINEMSPFLLLGFLLAGIMHSFIPSRAYGRFLSHNDFRSVFNAAIFGIPLPLCSCGVLPTAMSLRKEGASKGAVTSFLVATPQTGIDSIIATYSLMGLPFALTRPIAALTTSLFAGQLVNVLDNTTDTNEKGTQHLEKEHATHGTSNKKPFLQRCKEALEYMRNYNQDSYEQLKDDVNSIFNKNYSLQQIKSACYWYKLREFQKRRERESFSKPDFSERLRKSKSSRIEIKINGKWIAKSKYVYETSTGKKVQDDEVVVFLDGNINNFDLNNLLCVKKGLLSFVNGHLSGTCKNNAELTKCKYDIAKLKSLVCQKEKELNERR